MSLQGLRGTIFGLFGTILLATLWVTSISVLSDRANATALLTDAGVSILNPFLVGRGTGLSQQTYASIEAQARAHPSQAAALPLVKSRVLGREIVGHSYPYVVRLVYSRVAVAYYNGGPEAAFDIPPDLQQVLPNFGLFNQNNLPLVPGGPAPSQLPVFLQPFFTFVGLTPMTFTATEHQRVLGLLPWFWAAAVVLGVLAVVLNPSEQKLAGLAKGVVHSAWPIVAVLLGLWVAAYFYKAMFAPYVGVLGLVSRAFLPVYGTALVIGLASLLVMAVVPALQRRAQSKPPTGAPVGIGAGVPQVGASAGSPPPAEPPPTANPQG
jgi:hypothetical protein